MATTKSTAADKYPLPAFSFLVDWGGKRMGFSEASGLTEENQPIEYRDGSSPEYSPVKMPGLRKFSNITLKRGIVKGDNEFFDWLSTIQLNTVTRRDIHISLLNEQQKAVMTWTALKAFPIKIDGPHFKSTGNEVAIESIDIAHEGLQITLPGSKS